MMNEQRPRRRPLTCNALAAFVLLSCSCAARERGRPPEPLPYYGETPHGCDPLPPPRPLPIDLAAHEQGELSKEEQKLADDAACHAHHKFPNDTIPSDTDDAKLDEVCAKVTHANYVACRRYCLVSGRGRVGATLFEVVIESLHRFPDRYVANAGTCSANTGRELWKCLGLPPLPNRLDVAVDAPGNVLKTVTVRGPFIPSGDERTLVLREEEVGCGRIAWGIE